eukprot:tig00020684_g12906.t1
MSLFSGAWSEAARFHRPGPSSEERHRQQEVILDDAEDVLTTPEAREWQSGPLSRTPTIQTAAAPPLSRAAALSAGLHFATAMERVCRYSVEAFPECADWRDGVVERFFDSLRLEEADRRCLRSADARAALSPPPEPPPEAERARGVEHAVAFAVRERRGYDARTRAACAGLAGAWGAPALFAEAEARLSSTLAAAVGPAAALADGQQAGAPDALRSKWAAAAAALAVGGLVTAGGALALAPVLAGALKLLSVPAALSLKALSLLVSGLFGAAGAGLAGFRVDRAASGLSEFAFRPVPREREGGAAPAGPALHAVVAVPGFLPEAPPGADRAAARASLEADWARPLRALDLSEEGYVLAWEGDVLSDLGELVGGLARGEVAAHLSLGDVLGGTWARAQAKCEKAAGVLAGVLRGRVAGRRPVSLVGASLGARLVLEALADLARSRSPGVVMHAVLVGPRGGGDAEAWRRARSVVAGGLVCVRSARDPELRAASRVPLLGREPAGRAPVPEPGVLDVEASDLVASHAAYAPRGPEEGALAAALARAASALELELAHSAGGGGLASQPGAAGAGPAPEVDPPTRTGAGPTPDGDVRVVSPSASPESELEDTL